MGKISYLFLFLMVSVFITLTVMHTQKAYTKYSYFTLDCRIEYLSSNLHTSILTLCA
jgi:hypothetical protein